MATIASALCALTLAVCTQAVNAAVIPAFGTGLSDTGTLLNGGDVDPHFQLVSFPGQANGFPAVTYAVAGDLNQYNQSGTTSRWISWSPVWGNATPSGEWTYRTTFDLTGYDLSTAKLVGRFLSDDSATIFLNGVDTGITSSDENIYTSFLYTFGFVSGVNTLDFHVSNASFLSFNPSALRVDGVALTATAAAPEPSSLLLMFTSSAALLLRRKKLLSPDSRNI